MAAVENLDKARIAAKGAWEEAANGGAKLRDASPSEPEVYAEEWSRLEKLVRQKAQWQLEKDLVEAAAASPMGNAIKDLPVHLSSSRGSDEAPSTARPSARLRERHASPRAQVPEDQCRSTSHPRTQLPA
jgi:hypothetical protein